MGKAGGLFDDRADPTGVFVLRFEPVQLVRNFTAVPPQLTLQSAVPVVYHLNVRDPTSLFLARRFAMHDKDILYVTNAPVSEVEKVFRVIGAIAAPTLKRRGRRSRGALTAHGLLKARIGERSGNIEVFWCISRRDAQRLQVVPAGVFRSKLSALPLLCL